MSRIIRFELINLFKGISFYICGVCAIIMAVSSIGIRAIADCFMYGIGVKDLVNINYSGRMFLLFSPSQSDIPLLLGIVVAISVCSGYSGKTYRNIWSRGITRTETFAAKSVQAAVAGICFGLSTMIVGFLAGTAMWGIGKGWDYHIFLSAILELLLCACLGIVYCALSFVVKNMGVAVVIAVASPSLMTIGSAVLDYILEYKNIDLRVSNLVISNTMYNLSEAPYDEKMLATAFLCFAGYIITFLLFGWYGMRKDEI